MDREFDYFGFYVQIEARQPTTSDGRGVWLANVRYMLGKPKNDGSDFWAWFDRSLQDAYVEPESAIRAAAIEVCTYLDPQIEAIRGGKI